MSAIDEDDNPAEYKTLSLGEGCECDLVRFKHDNKWFIEDISKAILERADPPSDLNFALASGNLLPGWAEIAFDSPEEAVEFIFKHGSTQ